MDERAVSWKVLLPHGPRDKVLVLGMSEADLMGLKRTFAHVDTVLAERPYDLVVLGDKCDMTESRLLSFAQLLSPRGVLVTVGKAGSHLPRSGMGLSLLRRYGPLPLARPRILVPLSPRRAALEALSMHSPGSTRARMVVWLATMLRSLGVQRHLRKEVVSFYQRANASLERGGLLSWLSERLDYPLADLIIYTGSDSPRRKITALALADYGQADVIVKIADSPQGAEAIRQESEALQALARSPLLPHVPQVLLEGDYNGYSVQVQTKVPLHKCRQIPRLTHRHFQLLSQLSILSRREMAVKDTRAWNNLKTAAESPIYRELPGDVQKTLQTILSERCAQARVVCHRTHGDFAPWNIRAKGKEFFVVDWEDSEPSGLAFTDLFHFLYRQASLIGPWPGAGRWLEEMNQAAALLSQSAGLCLESLEIPLAIWALQEYLAHPSNHIEEMLRQTAGISRWPELKVPPIRAA